MNNQLTEEQKKEIAEDDIWGDVVRQQNADVKEMEDHANEGRN